MYVNLWKSAFTNNFFLVTRIFSRNFEFKNRCKDEYKDNNEKLARWSRKRVFHKIDLTAVWTHDSVGVKDLTKPFLNIGIKFDNYSPSGNWVGPYWDVYVHRKTVTVSSPPCVDWYLRNTFLFYNLLFSKNLIIKKLKINIRDT